MKLKYLPLAAALVSGAPAFAITVNMSDFSYAAPPAVSVSDTSGGGISYNGAAGRFNGVFDDSAVAPASSLTVGPSAITSSFTAYCAELTQTFDFNHAYGDYTWVAGGSYFTPQKAYDLARLFTVAGGFVTDNATSAAMQAAIWEIIYQNGSSYDVLGGTFKVTPQNPSYLTAFSTVNGFLANLGSVAAYQIDVLVSPSAQNFLVATPIPEPGTWALMIGGLGVLGFVARRRKPA